MIQEVTIKATKCICNLCHYEWVSISGRLPACCANQECRIREWNGVKKKRKPAPKPRPKIELPKPNRKRWVEEETDF
jgi:hypothetical protein